MQAKNLSSFPWKNLLDWYTENGRYDLPWRSYDIADINILIYRVWLSEILLQQTQASRVVGFFNRMIERFPTVESLAKTDYETFFPYYQGLGYYSRARNILKTAKIVHEEYHGIFPIESMFLIKLPGVGPYTTEAIRAFGYGIPTLSWDTNLEKVFARYYHGRKDERLSKEEKEQVEKDFHDFCSRHCEVRSNPGNNNDSSILPGSPRLRLAMTERDIVRSINNALMDFAALVDLKDPANINWSDYPIQGGKFYETRGSLEPQEGKKSVTFPIPDATIIVTLHENHRIYYGSPLTPQSPLLQRGEAVPKTPSPLGEGWGEVGYSPFILPPSLHRDTREYVKSYFREHYGLELSVRPPHRKWLSEDGKPYIAVNAQVQVGVIPFTKWNKKGERIE